MEIVDLVPKPGKLVRILPEKNLTPTGRRILVQRDAPTETTPSGLIILESSQELATWATVHKIGRYVDIDIKPGDRILLRQKLVGFRCVGANEEWLLIIPDDVLAVEEQD